MRDDALLRQLHTDPERGMKRLMDQYMGLVYAVVKARLPASSFCPADIEGCVADTFSEFYCGLDRFDPGKGSIKAMLCVIAGRNALDRVRSLYAQAGNLSLDDDRAAQYPDDFSLEGDFEKKEQRQELLDEIRNLGQPDREIILRKFFLAQSSKEIAQALGMTVSNVDTRTHRAVQKLRKRFGGDTP